MRIDTPHQGLALANELVAEGRLTFTFEDVEKRLGKSKTATANLLKRMQTAGLIDRVRRGHYAVRQLGVLGTPAAAEDVALSVGAALKGVRTVSPIEAPSTSTTWWSTPRGPFRSRPTAACAPGRSPAGRSGP